MFNGTEENFTDVSPGLDTIHIEDEPFWFQVTLSILLLIVFVASLIGNTLTCIVIYYDKTMHTVTNYYLFNLAISDLLVTFPILIVIYQTIADFELVEIKYGMISCRFIICIHALFVAFLWNNGILVMTALSIERYIAICYPMSLKGTPACRRVGKIIAIIWVIAIIETLPQLWTVDVMETDTTLICFFLQTPIAKLLTGALGVITFVVPLVIMVFVYTMIACKVNDHENDNIRDSVCVNGFKRKNVNRLIALTGSFVFCWLPYFLTNMSVFVSNKQVEVFIYKWFPVIQKVAMFNSWFTTALNPLLFSVMSIKFRKSLKMLWNSKLKRRYLRAKRGDPSDTSRRQKSTSYFLTEKT